MKQEIELDDGLDDDLQDISPEQDIEAVNEQVAREVQAALNGLRPRRHA